MLFHVGHFFIFSCHTNAFYHVLYFKILQIYFCFLQFFFTSVYCKNNKLLIFLIPHNKTVHIWNPIKFCTTITRSYTCCFQNSPFRIGCKIMKRIVYRLKPVFPIFFSHDTCTDICKQ